jgi:hypothetical protein
MNGPADNAYGILQPNGDDYIGEVYSWEEDKPEEAQANARLIAAAPEMAEALEAIVNESTDGRATAIARALLSRIRGDVA